MRRPILIITIVILILLLIGLILVVFKSKKDWQVYENARYNFSLKYPPKWQLGEPETNNAGREFFSPDKKILCYGYGFENAIITEDGDTQTLEEFISWVKKALDMRLIEQKETVLGGEPAIELISQVDGKIKDSVFALGEETGRGLFCVFDSLEAKDNFEENFNRIVESFKINVSLNEGEAFIFGHEGCEPLLSGAVVPLKDLQTFLDEKYVEVVITSRDYWDKDKLPPKVLELEGQDYMCYPMPFEFEEASETPGVHAPPAVKKVQWTCELEHTDWQYLEGRATEKKIELGKQGYTCEQKYCLDKNAEQSFVWFCYK